MDALLRGEVDLVKTGESLVVGRALQREQIRVIASVNQAFSLRLVGRKDRGISDVAGLAGRRIGLSRQTSAEFYLGRFLELRGLAVQKVTLVDLPPSKWVEAVSDGSVDAAVVRGPNVGAIKERIGDGVVVWPVQENQPIFGVLSGRADWIGEHPEQVQRVLKAFAQAADYAVAIPRRRRGSYGRRWAWMRPRSTPCGRTTAFSSPSTCRSSWP